MSSSESVPLEQRREASVHLEKAMSAIECLGDCRGSSIDEIAAHLVYLYLMEARMSRALVARAIDKGMNDRVLLISLYPHGAQRYFMNSCKQCRLLMNFTWSKHETGSSSR